MIALHDHQCIMRESDDGDQFQRYPFPPRGYSDGGPLVCGVSAEAISQKESPYSGCWCWVDQNVVLGQCRMALQTFFNRLHCRLPERHALLVAFVAERDDRMQPLPGHPL